MTFSSREEAGRQLGCHLAERGAHPDIVLGLPRGGVIVAAEVARILHVPLDVLLVRKIGHPLHPEFAVGAMAEHDVLRLDEKILRQTQVDRRDLDEVIALETERLRGYQSAFHPSGPPDLAHKTVLLVDDGLATGATTEAAVLSARRQQARAVWVAAPVASEAARDRLLALADGVMALLVDPDFVAVGQYYDLFPQTGDDEVVALLHSFSTHVPTHRDGPIGA